MSNTRAIILCAGEGKRLKPLTDIIPKCLAKVNGSSIVENAIIAFSQIGITEVTLVVGHLANKIKEVIGDTYNGVKILYINNDQYSTTNSMYGLWLGLLNTKEDIWLLEGDVFLDPSILKINHSGDISWYADSNAENFDGAFLSAENNRVASLKIVRDNSPKTGLYKSIGLLFIRHEAVKKIQHWLEVAISEGRQNDYYDLILGDKFKEIDCELVDTFGYRWYEIDSLQDLQNANKLFGGQT